MGKENNLEENTEHSFVIDSYVDREATGKQNEALHVIESLKSPSFLNDVSALPRDTQLDLHKLLTRADEEVRRRIGPIWTEHLPEGRLRTFRKAGRLQLETVQVNSFPQATRRLCEAYQANIIAEGDAAVAHLCPSLKTFAFLRSNGISTLGKLEEALRADSLRTMLWPYGNRLGSMGFELTAKLRELAEERAAELNQNPDAGKP